MTLRERLRGIPADAWWGYATAAAFGAWFISCVLVGPDLLLLAFGCLTLPVLAVVTLVLAYQLAVRRAKKARALPLFLMLGCVTVLVGAPGVTVELHLIASVYWAGGPNALNDWAQDVMNEQKAERESGKADTEQPHQRITPAYGGGSVPAHRFWSNTGPGTFTMESWCIPEGRARRPRGGSG
ncbi:hypothetical protein VT84_03900 [Gemmata sp. SH-PL17]|uniref:hypothetical protein n=1 Tax=Gemmata sp. SH-PL17 TaxID=1630693 RepID=UPI00078B9065|nr:hypothetical protein [Gemmata sp. SH-PL17]AMV23528.1 hypothetical protein VT84_03900 [Gemmata sp. SH-PL17]